MKYEVDLGGGGGGGQFGRMQQLRNESEGLRNRCWRIQAGGSRCRLGQGDRGSGSSSAGSSRGIPVPLSVHYGSRIRALFGRFAQERQVIRRRFPPRAYGSEQCKQRSLSAVHE